MRKMNSSPSTAKQHRTTTKKKLVGSLFKNKQGPQMWHLPRKCEVLPFKPQYQQQTNMDGRPH
jgi:hypothetical protein